MKITSLLLLSILVATGCYAGPDTNETSVTVSTQTSAASAEVSNAVINMRFDEVVIHENLQLRLLKVMDSRCPTGVNCVWAGEAKVILEATDAGEKETPPLEFQLILKVRGEPVIASVFGYELELLDVNPFPDSEVTPGRSDYVAAIKISEVAPTP